MHQAPQDGGRVAISLSSAYRRGRGESPASQPSVCSPPPPTPLRWIQGERGPGWADQQAGTDGDTPTISVTLACYICP